MVKRKDWKFGPKGQRPQRRPQPQLAAKKRRAEAVELAAIMFREILLSDMEDLADMIVTNYDEPPADVPADIITANNETYKHIRTYIERFILGSDDSEEAEAVKQRHLTFIAKVITAYLMMHQSPVLGFFLENGEAVMAVLFNKFAIRTKMLDPENPPVDPNTKLN